MANSHRKKAKPFIDWTLNSAGSPDAEWGSADWAIGVRLQIQAFLKDRESSITHLSDYYEAMSKSEGWRHLFDPAGHPFTTFELFCYAKQPWGLGYERQVIDSIIHERKTTQQQAQNAKDLGVNHRPVESYVTGFKADTENKPYIVRDKTDKVNQCNKAEYGNRAEYLTARIARDYPVILKEMKEGKYPSVRAAAKAAGIIRELTTVEKMKKLWLKMTAEEKEAFQMWAIEQLDS